VLELRIVDLREIIQRMHGLLRGTLREDLRLQVIVPAEPCLIRADVGQIEQVLMNLAVNAQDAMPNGGALRIELVPPSASRQRPPPLDGPAEGCVDLLVADSGCGMDAATREHAFEPFFTTKEPGQGTGLGLSQVYGFIKQSGGHLKIYSEVGHGTTVKIYLPRNAYRQEEDEELQDSVVGKGEPGETILIVEDDADLRAYLAEVLRGLGYYVLIAPNAQSALGTLERLTVRVDLLLTDVVMPGMNGRDLGRRAKQIRPGLRVLHMTGYSRNAVIHQGKLDEGVDPLQKPISQSHLAIRVREALDRPSEQPRPN
jgi:CheY-like chemotaxis protein